MRTPYAFTVDLQQPLAMAHPAASALRVIDVRTEREFRISAVQGAVNLPLAQLAQRIHEVAADKATPLVLYCASGARSASGCQVLQRLGYGQVRNAGGLYAAAADLKLPLR